MPEIRIKLDELEFETLVAGGEVEVITGDSPAVKIILADIGWDNMIDIIESKQDEANL